MYKKILIISFALILMISCFYISNADAFDPNKITGATVTSTIENTSKNFFGSAIDVVQTFCVGIAVVMLIVHAIRYMAAAPEGKAELKKELTMYTIGAVIIFAASTIVEIIQKFYEKNIKA